MLNAGKCYLTLQSPRGLAGEPDKEALAAEPQEDDSGGCHLPCLSDASAMSRLLVKEALATCSLPLTFEGGALVKNVELRKRPPGGRPPPAGVHEQRACRGAVGGGQPVPGRRKWPAQ